MTIQLVLPDPDYGITAAGEEGGTLGQPFASVKLSLSQPDEYDRGIRGRLIHRNNKTYAWNIGITYNPMTRAQFSPIYNFLMEKYGSHKPFYVALPQYKQPYNTSFDVIPDLPLAVSALAGGQTDLKCTYDGTANKPTQGDMFNIVDPTNTQHTQVYMVCKASNVGTTLTINFVPRIRNITDISNTTIRFNSPLFKVIQTQDIQEYSLGNNNLYSFSLRLQETS